MCQCLIPICNSCVVSAGECYCLWDNSDANFLSFALFFFFLGGEILFRASPEAFGSFQARVRNGATASSLHNSHRNTGSKLCLQATP